MFEGQHQRRDVGITFLQFVRARYLMEWRGVKEEGGKKRLGVILLSHLPNEHVCAFVSNAGNGRRAKKGAGVQLYSDQNRTCFLFPTCVFFPNYARTFFRVAQKRGGKKTHPSPPSTMEGEEEVVVVVGGTLFFPFFLTKQGLMLFMFLVLFVCISSYSPGSPRTEGREKDSSHDGL